MKIFPAWQTQNVNFLYYLRGLWIHSTGLYLPSRKLQATWNALPPAERDALQKRIDYYCKRETPFRPGEDAFTLSSYRHQRRQFKTNYYLDLWEHLRHFSQDFRFHCRFGDKTHVEAVPTFVKARPVGGDNENSVLMKLNKIRHYNLIVDRVPWEDKKDILVWRGNGKQPNRKRLLELAYHNPLCDVGQTESQEKDGHLYRPRLSIREQLQYKFVLSLEGNDVATNLKWIMSSNSLCFMPIPRHETWFMEGRLEAGVHFAPLQDDFSDLDEKIAYYLAHPEEAKQMVRNAQTFVSQFRDSRREALIGMKVLEKYARLSGQSNKGPD